MRLHDIAPALLLAVAACSVETDSLKPKTDAECAAKDASTKACGYKCVRVDAPATGCGTPGDCSPCQAYLPNTQAACDTSAAVPACTVRCVTGYGDCDHTGTSAGTNGCETFTGGADAGNCGLCGRSCDSGVCTSGACQGVALATPAGIVPRGIMTSGGTVYYVDAQAPGNLWNADTSTTVVSRIGTNATYLTPYGSGALVTGTVSDASSSYGWAQALIYVPTLTGHSDTIWNVGAPVSATDLLSGVAASGTYAFFSAAEESAVYYDDGSSWSTLESGVHGARGFGIDGSDVYYGSTSNGGELHVATNDGAGNFSKQVITTGAGHPSRVAVYHNVSATYPVPLVFWISEDDGSVRGIWRNYPSQIVTLVSPEGHVAYDVDIIADANGVYWSNWWTGRVQMWRARDDAVIDVGFSSAPFGLAIRGGKLYWSDDFAKHVYWVTIPP